MRTYTGGGTFLAEDRAPGGVAVVPFALGVDAVGGVTAGGVSLGRIRVPGRTADFGN